MYCFLNFCFLSNMKLHLHVQKILCFGKVGEVLNHKFFGTSEEGGWTVGFRNGEEGQTVTKIHSSYQEVAACSRQGWDLRPQKKKKTYTVDVFVIKQQCL